MGPQLDYRSTSRRMAVVYDQECDKFDLDTLESLALTLSSRLQCTAMPCFNADDDVLWFAMYEGGRRTSRYASTLREFEDRTELPSVRYFAADIGRIFEKPARVGQVRCILRRGRGFLGLPMFVKTRLAYVFEIQRHQDLATLLGLPLTSIGLGYQYVERSELAPGMRAETLLPTNGGRFN
jgi:hypothetical protein